MTGEAQSAKNLASSVELLDGLLHTFGEAPVCALLLRGMPADCRKRGPHEEAGIALHVAGQLPGRRSVERDRMCGEAAGAQQLLQAPAPGDVGRWVARNRML